MIQDESVFIFKFAFLMQHFDIYQYINILLSLSIIAYYENLYIFDISREI